MQNKLLHTPEGVRDIYNGECEKKLVIQSSIEDTIKSYGYRFIQTPTFEFFDIFGKEVGTTSSKELYKFFDREGNTLVLRPDITPSIARAAAKYFSENNEPIRLCYEGNVFINNSSYQGRLKECTQIGAEFIGDNSVDADSEIISMVVQCLLASGIKDFQISIGHADIFSGLMEAAGLKEDEEEKIRNLISNKNFFGVEEFVEEKGLSSELKMMFSLLGKMYTTPADWKDMMDAASKYPVIHQALQYLDQLNELLKIYGVDRYVSFELGIISNYQYYTGIIFSGYTFGSGEPIVKGGRYDNLLSYFGKEAPSIGFAITVDQLLLAIDRQKIAVEVDNQKDYILYDEAHRNDAIVLANQLREDLKVVELLHVEDEATIEQYRTYTNCKLTILYGDK